MIRDVDVMAESDDNWKVCKSCDTLFAREDVILINGHWVCDTCYEDIRRAIDKLKKLGFSGKWEISHVKDVRELSEDG